MTHANHRIFVLASSMLVSFMLAALVPATTVEADLTAVLSIDPVASLKVGQTPSGVVIAHLTAGGPVVGVRLDLLIDTVIVGSGVTDTTGAAQISFRRELAAGDHDVVVKFDGGRDVAPATASAGMHVWPADQSQLRIDPLPSLQLGQDPSGIVVAHLAAAGAPVTGARLALVMDGVLLGNAVTDASGTAELHFRRELALGEHQVEVRFDGSKATAPSSASAQMQVGSAGEAQLRIDPVPPLQLGQDLSGVVVAHLAVGATSVAGARLGLLIDGVPVGNEATDANGTAQIRFRRDLAAGDHVVQVKFDGSRIMTAITTSGSLSVMPLGTSVLTVEPLPSLQVGQDPTLLVVAHLTSGGAPVGGARLALQIDGAPAGTGVTDSGGTVELRVRRELADGDHMVEMHFDGSRSVAPASASVSLAVQPQETGVVTVEPLDTLQVGQDQAVTIIAHLSTGMDAPVAGVRLAVLIDSAPVGTGFTDASGTAELHFRREVAAGEHLVEVRFDGSRSVAASSALQPLVVLPIATRGVSLDPPPTLQVGQDPGATIVGHMSTDNGDPVAGARLALLIDGAPVGTGLTDASGAAELHFRRELSAGEHQLELRFEGSRSAAPSATSTMLTVLPVAVRGLTLEPLKPLQIGQDPAATVVAHLATDTGEPVSGERLSLLVDGAPLGTTTTGVNGEAELRFRRELPAGEHSIEVRFEGSRAASPASVSASLTVLPATSSGLSIESLPTLKVGQSSLATVVAHLAAESGEPVGGARLELLVDSVQERLGLTDASGAAQLKFRPDLLPGEHQVEVRFAGSRGVAPTTASAKVTVLPAQVEVQMTPPLAGARIAVDGRVFTSGDDGIARLEMDRPGAYHLEVLPWDTNVAGMKLGFNRWADEVFTSTRDVVVPQTTHLEVGFDTSFLVGLSFVDPQGMPVGAERITSATLVSSTGSNQAFQPGEQHWLQGTRIVRRTGGLAETRLQYAVDGVMLEGSNAVNSREQRFYLSPNLQAPVQVLLHSMRIAARTVLIDVPTGSGIWLQRPDGQTQWYPLGPHGDVAVSSLPRGNYVARVEAAGISFAQPIALSRDQDVPLQVVSYPELAAAAVLSALLVLGLLLVGARFRATRARKGA